MNLEGNNLSRNRHINVLVVVPTRELAVQVREVFQLFNSALTTPLKTMAVYGGVAINPQMKAMMGVNILVATPGRLLELIDSNAVSLSAIDTLVLDEADKMLNLGFKDEMNRIFSLLPKKRQNLLFSAFGSVFSNCSKSKVKSTSIFSTFENLACKSSMCLFALLYSDCACLIGMLTKIVLFPVCAQRNEVKAESTPPDIPTIKPESLALSQYALSQAVICFESSV